MRRAFAAVSFAAILAGVVFAQSNSTPPGVSPAFEATDVHASGRATNPYTLISGGVLRGERYDLRKVTMLDLIRIAYGVDAGKIVGGPSWLELDRFDVAGKAPESTPPETLKLMLQALLADRFRLALHKDSRPLPGFGLTVGKGRPKMKEATGPGDARCQLQKQPDMRAYSCRNITMDAFAQSLHGMAGDYLTIPIVNLTGLEGSWDFDLKWNARSQVIEAGVERTTIFSAVEKQLGLMLEPQKVPTPVLVVDRVNEKPTANALGVERTMPPRPVEFEVADVKLSRPDESRTFRVTPGGGLEERGNSLRILIATAWDIDWDHSDEMIAGATKLLDSTYVDVVAKTSTAARGTAPAGADFLGDDIRLMLRMLLIDRFKMKTHYEDRPIPAYTLSAVKPKLKKAEPSNRSNCKDAGVVANDPRDLNPLLSRLLTCENMTMAQFAAQLQRLDPGDLPSDVADATGLGGAWDFTLSFSPGSLLRGAGVGAGQPGGGGTASDPVGGISLFEALNKQLGLKLETTKRLLPVIVIDHIEEKPTDN